MSVHVSSRVWRDSKASGSELLLLLAIADMANDEGIAWPSQETLRGRLRQTDRNVRRLIDKLVAMGELLAVLPSMAERQAGRHTTYTVCVPAVLQPTNSGQDVLCSNSGQVVRSDQPNSGQLVRSNSGHPGSEQRTPVSAYKPSYRTSSYRDPGNKGSSTIEETTNPGVSSQQTHPDPEENRAARAARPDGQISASQRLPNPIKAQPSKTSNANSTDTIESANHAAPARAAAPKPSGNKLAQVVDLIRVAGVEPVINGGRDGKACSSTSAEPPQIAAAYVAVATGTYGTDFERRRLSISAACEWVAGYLVSLAEPKGASHASSHGRSGFRAEGMAGSESQAAISARLTETYYPDLVGH